jgi:hypothetical protein
MNEEMEKWLNERIYEMEDTKLTEKEGKILDEIKKHVLWN